MQLAIKIAKIPMYIIGYFVIMTIGGFILVGLLYGAGELINWILHALAVTQ